MKVGVVGATGFMGAEAVRLVIGHPMLNLEMICAGSSAGKDMGDVRPSFAGLELEVEPANPRELAERCETAILALPHGESAPLAIDLYQRGLTVIDLGSDFRLEDPLDHERYYGRKAPDPEILKEARYSLPELTGKPEGRLIASPGCFATAMCLAIAPLANRLPLGAKVAVFGATGSSGSGIAPAPNVHHSLRSTSFVAYKPLAHQHIGEVRQLIHRLGGDLQIDFVPHSAPMVRGIHVTAMFDRSSLLDPKSSLNEAFQSQYEDRPFVKVQEGPVNVGWATGSNRAFVGVTENDQTAVVMVALDNLLKGGAGQAIQSLNLLNDWDETTGLPMVGMWP